MVPFVLVISGNYEYSTTALVWPRWWSFEDKGQLCLDLCSKISSRKKYYFIRISLTFKEDNLGTISENKNCFPKLVHLGVIYKLCRLGRGGGGGPKDDLLQKPYLIKNCQFWDNIFYGRPLTVFQNSRSRLVMGKWSSFKFSNFFFFR